MEDIRLGTFRINEAGFAVPHAPPGTRWTDRLLAAGLLHWPVIALALAMFAALLIFGHVVREAVRSSERRHLASATHQRNTWQCNALLGVRARETCLRQLNLPHPDPAPQPARPAQSLAVLADPTPVARLD